MGRVEIGAGSWMQTPNGGGYSEDTSGLLSLSGDYHSDKKDSNEIYVWMLIEHSIPIVPNIRLEYVSVTDEGITDGAVAGYPIDEYATTIEMRQFDIIPYYNILDNTAWVTLDLGLDLKVIETKADILLDDGTLVTRAIHYTNTETDIVPLLYIRTRVEIPDTNIGFEADVKYITNGDSTVYDIRAKVDYTLDFVPVYQPGVEIGYRVQNFALEDADTNSKTDIDFAGVYAGLTVRF